MWKYEKILEFPVNIKKKDLKMAKYLVTQFGGGNGELGAALRYLTQRFIMPTNEAKALLTDIGTEELAHIEMIITMIYQLTKDATVDELKEAGLDTNYAEHGNAIFASNSNGVPFTASYISISEDYIACLLEDLAAEEKARACYEQLMNMTDDVDILEPLSFLRQREIVHFQRFGEMLVKLQELKENKN